MPDLGFLRVLQLVHQQTSVLVEDLKAYELPSVIPKSPTDASEFNRSLKGATSSASNTATAATISTMLETAMEELFVPYTEGQRYLEKESRSLGEMYASYLAKFTRYHVRLVSSVSPRIKLTVGFRKGQIRRANPRCLGVWWTSLVLPPLPHRLQGRLRLRPKLPPL